MDILYISPYTKDKLLEVCETELVEKVLDHFQKVGKIVEKEDNFEPSSRSWIITDYISDKSINEREKLSVILAFANADGYVQINERTEHGDVNVLCMLKELKYISEDVFDYFVEAFFNFSRGNGVKFSLITKCSRF